MLVKININNKDLVMEVDTGASVLLMLFDSYCKNLQGIKLNNCNEKLKCVSSDMLEVVGEAIEHVTKYKYIIKFKWIITKDTLEPLLGRDWLCILMPNWKDILIGCKSVEVEHLLNEVEKLINMLKHFQKYFQKIEVYAYKD